jgi:hypothetical protein
VLLEEVNRWRHGAGIEPRKPNTLPLDFREPTPQQDDSSSFQQQRPPASQGLSNSSNSNNNLNFVTSGSEESPLVPDDDGSQLDMAVTQMSAFVPPDATGSASAISDSVSPDAMPVPQQVGHHTDHGCDPITPMGNIWNGLNGMDVSAAAPPEIGLDLDGMDMTSMGMFDGNDPSAALTFQQLAHGQDGGAVGTQENMFYARQPMHPFEPMNFMEDSRLRRT